MLVVFCAYASFLLMMSIKRNTWSENENYTSIVMHQNESGYHRINTKHNYYHFFANIDDGGKLFIANVCIFGRLCLCFLVLLPLCLCFCVGCQKYGQCVFLLRAGQRKYC